ncbi:3-deoxy-D-manno-octulosonic acid kinase [Vibrio sp. FNV 38]|nr:3-deoxy-D-manno-octulosonic acid kinase [Vibrio sp. FNV 38]
MFTYKNIAHTHFWYDPELLADNVESVFDVDYWRSKNAVIGSAQGRGTTWFVSGVTGDYALRHYHRGGLFGKLIKDSYLFQGLEQSRSYQELLILKALTSAGVNVPAAVAAKVTVRGLSYQADILVEKIAGAKDLFTLLGEKELSDEYFKSIGQEIKKMHEAGVNHTDLNIHNLLIDGNHKVWIIDFDKCHFSTGEHWKKNNLKRLFRSFEKEGKRGAIQYQPSQLHALRFGYGNSA